jgi:DNA-binding transcriptional ArsR family regulator
MKQFDPTDSELARVASTFAALGSEQRLAVLRTLVRAGPEGLSIGELGARCGVTGSTLTHHMKILAQAGLVGQKRQGRSIICAAVAYGGLRHLSQFLLRECCADAAQDHTDHTDHTDHKDHDHG